MKKEEEKVNLLKPECNSVTHLTMVAKVKELTKRVDEQDKIITELRNTVNKLVAEKETANDFQSTPGRSKKSIKAHVTDVEKDSDVVVVLKKEDHETVMKRKESAPSPAAKSPAQQSVRTPITVTVANRNVTGQLQEMSQICFNVLIPQAR